MGPILFRREDPLRITNQIIDRKSLEAIRRSTAGLDETATRAATGIRLHNPSDDPAAYVGVAAADRRLAGLEQYRRNIATAEARLRAEEGVLDQITDLLARARELATGQAASSGTATTRQIAKQEVDQLLGELVALGNTRHGGLYLFGGDFADTAPFSASGVTTPARPPVGGGSVEIDDGRTIPINHDGQRVFVDSGAIAALQALSDALGNDSTPDIAQALTDLNLAFDSVQDLFGEVGARVRQLETALSNIDALDITLRTQRADLAEADLEEAISALASRQTAYQAALLATARLDTLTLTDYLR